MPEQDEYEIIIGLEIHAQLNTRTKLFCADSTNFGLEPNTQTSVISLGHPGTLPKLNREAITKAVRLGLATECTIIQHNYFARKNYFYPDLPKGYQISQHTTPICRDGRFYVEANHSRKAIRINRIHMEEDAGKSSHDNIGDDSFLDFNRAGMPLLEIVTEPDIRDASEAAAFVTGIRQLVRHLDVCDGNMEQGNLRCDVNISVRLKGDQELGTKVEIKNLNSIRFIKKAIEFEKQRLIDLHRSGAKILQETRGFDEQSSTTYSIRVKEDEDDYRYFPEPDLPPFYIRDEVIENIRNSMPPLHEEIKNILHEQYGLTSYDSEQLSSDMELYQLFLQLTEHTSQFKSAANWIIGPVRNYFSANEIPPEEASIPLKSLAEIIRLTENGRISYNVAVQKVFPDLLKDPLLNIEDHIAEKGWFIQTSHVELDQWINQSLETHAGKIADYRKGKKGLLSLFVGEVMKLSGGTADAQLVTEKIKEKLKP